jgi:hypothetical protein
MAATHFSGPVESENGFVTGTTGMAAGTELVTAGRVLVEADNGITLVLADASAGAITLPDVALTGFQCRVLCGFAITASTAVTAATVSTITGTLVVNGATVLAETEDAINFILNLAEVGDYVDFVSNGSAWIVNGIGGAGGSITATT